MSKNELNNNFIDLEALIEGVIESGLDPSFFNVDIDIPRANNVIEFALSDKFVNGTLWAKQAEQAVRLLAEWCPKCSDEDFMNDVPVGASMDTFQERVVLLNKGICPKCGKNRIELFENLPYELVSCLGQRSGKTALTGGVLAPYILHRFLKLSDPARYYGTMRNSYFSITFVAITKKQAGELWQAFTGTITSSPWFTAYNKFLRDEEKKKGVRPGTLLKIMNTFVYYGNKRIVSLYEAADGKALRGSTRVAAAIDELGRFAMKDNKVQANANETYASLSNSLRTLRSASDILWDSGDYDTMPGYMLNISSPASQYDKIMSLLKEGENDDRKVCFHFASWEASPLITRKSLKNEERNNPSIFWRDYGAVPPLANNPFISNEKVVYKTNGKYSPLFKTRPIYIDDKAGTGRFIAAELIDCNIDRQTARVISVDAGEKANHFSILVHHIRQDDKNNICIYLDGVIEVAPEVIVEKDEVISVHFPTMLDLILKLCDNLNVLFVIFDRWQSVDLTQRLRDKGIDAEQYSPKYQDFTNLRSLIFGETYKTPQWELKNLSDLDLSSKQEVKKYPYTHTAVQIATVRQVGKKIIKPEFGEDDIWRSIVLATYKLTHPKFQKKFLAAGYRQSIRNSGSLGAVRLKSTQIGMIGGISKSTIASARLFSRDRRR